MIDWPDEDCDFVYTGPYAGAVSSPYEFPEYKYIENCGVIRETSKSYLFLIDSKAVWIPKKFIAGPHRGLNTKWALIHEWAVYNILKKAGIT